MQLRTSGERSIHIPHVEVNGENTMTSSTHFIEGCFSDCPKDENNSKGTTNLAHLLQKWGILLLPIVITQVEKLRGFLNGFDGMDAQISQMHLLTSIFHKRDPPKNVNLQNILKSDLSWFLPQIIHASSHCRWI